MPPTSDRTKLHPPRPRVAMAGTALLCLAMLAGPVGCGSDDGAADGSQKAGKSGTPSGGGYLATVLRSRKTAETEMDKIHIKTLWTTLNFHAIEHEGKFPPTLKDLASSALRKAPGDDGQPYMYIPGQTDNMPRTNVLAYEETPVHNGKALVLRLGGAVELLAPEQLEQAVEETKKRLVK